MTLCIEKEAIVVSLSIECLSGSEKGSGGQQNDAKNRPYIQSVIDHISGRLESTNLISSMSVFDPVTFPMMKTN